MRPLDGIKVITLEYAIAAPFCTRQLADLGARAIKVERPRVVDALRVDDGNAGNRFMFRLTTPHLRLPGPDPLPR